MIEITDRICIPEHELKFDFIRSGGPGGQKVNKTSSAVQLRFDIRNSKSLPDDVKELLETAAGSYVSNEGILVIRSSRYRSQIRNRENAVRKLVKLILKAVTKSKIRVSTEPTNSSKHKRLAKKRIRGRQKKYRSYKLSEEDFE